MRSINLGNLETAFWIARLGSFTAAAERLYTTQPAVSARMRELESALGVKLFVRVGRGVQLTLEGRDFLRAAEPILQQLEVLTTTFSSGYSASGTVRIGAGNISMSWFPSMVNQLRASMPELTYDIEIDLAGKLLQKLEARKLDLAIVAGPVEPDKFNIAQLGYDRMLWVMSPDRECGPDGFSLNTFLKQIPLWCVQRESFYWSDAMRIVVEQGADPRHFNAISNMAAAREIVLGDAGIGLLSATLIREDLEQGKLIEVPGLRQGDWVELSAVCPKDSSSPRIIRDIMQAAQSASTLAKSPTAG